MWVLVTNVTSRTTAVSAVAVYRQHLTTLNENISIFSLGWKLFSCKELAVSSYLLLRIFVADDDPGNSE